jgi:hypothetical protein
VSATELLLEITNCPLVADCRRGHRGACSRVVGVQAASAWSEHHLPEPWNGELESAPLLFISSNPAIDPRESYPTPTWSDVERIDFFRDRFSGGSEAWTSEFRTLLQDGSYDANPRAGKYWREIHNRAIELLGAGARPGIDYALTEVVHCKSAKNEGVEEARLECGSRYLDRVLEASAARVIILIGSHAWRAFSDRYGGPPAFGGVTDALALPGQERMTVSLPAPGSSQSRKLIHRLSEDELAYARRLVRAP